jgi:hypothetical protein
MITLAFLLETFCTSFPLKPAESRAVGRRIRRDRRVNSWGKVGWL